MKSIIIADRISMLDRIRILRVALTAVLVLAPVVHVRAETFGHANPMQTPTSAIPSAGVSADFKRGSRFTLSEAGSLDGLCAYLDGNGGVSGRQDVDLALYRDANGVPGAKIVESNGGITIVSGSSGSWSCFSVAPLPVPAGSYWIVLGSSSPGGVARYYYDGPANWYGNADTYSDGPADPFGNGTAGAGTMVVFAFYIPATQLKAAGRTTVGTTPSKGMTADFKRASSFTLTEPGRLESMSAYLDTLGGASGIGQAWRLALYRDANGVPGSKVVESFGSSGTAAGRRANWLTDGSYSPLLSPGKYWIAIHTGATGGLLRNFADGTGNWYGNADPYSDGASSPYGAASAGNGTLSAFISYQPGNFSSLSLGRTDIATQPSKGLTANAIRGSRFSIGGANEAVLMGLYAYLDGKGGATGSQQLRMALYDISKKDELPYNLLAQSDVVSIAADRPPGWVYFPVPAVRLESFFRQYWITIQSGDTGGVVRDYGDGPANFVSSPDVFSNGASPLFGEENNFHNALGTVTLSVYATYSVPPPPPPN